MSKYIFTREDGSRFVADLDEDEAALVDAAMAEDEQNDDEDEDDEEDDGDDDGEPAREADSAEEFDRVEAVYRKERAAIKTERPREVGRVRSSEVVHRWDGFHGRSTGGAVAPSAVA